ncbi:MAG: PAQR family membrane homeostasis protein TrhA [Bacilli bacterium]
MKFKRRPDTQSLGEEIANAITHGIGALFGVVALILMLIKAQDTVAKVTVTVFGLGIILLYSMSCLYHSFKKDTRVKRVFKRFDHLSIYILIGATYTPIYLIAVDQPLGYILTAVIWAIIILGVVFKAIWIKKFAMVHLILYLILGWNGVFIFRGVYQIAPAALWLILTGGVIYSLGVLFYSLRPFKYAHFIWHIFCIAGTFTHFLAIYLYII